MLAPSYVANFPSWDPKTNSKSGSLFMSMLLFVRAKKWVIPFEKFNQQWICPYGDELMSMLVGCVLLTIAAVDALAVGFFRLFNRLWIVYEPLG